VDQLIIVLVTGPVPS